MQRRQFLAAGGAGLLRARDRQPNLLFLMTDQMRFDAMSCAGNSVLATPNLDRLARDGVRFENDMCPFPVCVPSRVGMLTGKSMANTGVRGNLAANDPDRYFTLIDEEITVLTPANPYRVEGIPDDREEFEWGIRTGRSRVGYFQEMQRHVQRYGDVAIVTYFSRGSYGREEAVAYLKETDVLVRREDGWKIVHIHVSASR